MTDITALAPLTVIFPCGGSACALNRAAEPRYSVSGRAEPALWWMGPANLSSFLTSCSLGRCPFRWPPPFSAVQTGPAELALYSLTESALTPFHAEPTHAQAWDVEHSASTARMCVTPGTVSGRFAICSRRRWNAPEELSLQVFDQFTGWTQAFIAPVF